MTRIVACRAACSARALLFFILVPLQAAASQQPVAGSVSGVVTDSATGAPAAAARARLIEAHLEESIHEDGRFAFRGVVPGTYTLVVQRLGYRPAQRRVVVQPAADTRVDVALAAAVVRLSTAVVTGTLTERPRDEVLSPTSVVGDADLDRLLQGTLG